MTHPRTSEPEPQSSQIVRRHTEPSPRSYTPVLTTPSSVRCRKSRFSKSLGTSLSCAVLPRGLGAFCFLRTRCWANQEPFIGLGPTAPQTFHQQVTASGSALGLFSRSSALVNVHAISNLTLGARKSLCFSRLGASRFDTACKEQPPARLELPPHTPVPRAQLPEHPLRPSATARINNAVAVCHRKFLVRTPRGQQQ